MKFRLKSLKAKLSFAASLLLLLIFTIETIIDTRTTKQELIQAVNNEAMAFSGLATKTLVEAYERYHLSGFQKFREIIEDTSNLSADINRIRLVDVQGRVRFDTKDLTTRKKSNSWETIDSSLLEKIRQLEPSYVYKDERSNILIEIISPFVEEWGKHEYSIIYSISYEAVEKNIKESIIRTILSASFWLVVSLVVVNSVAITITKPLSDLQEGVKLIGGGNLDYKLKITTVDETGRVAQEFNRMIERLKESRKELEESKISLEIKVKERTKELQQRVDELERFHRVTVGREMKMIELKKEIERLNKKLEKKAEPN